MKLTILGATGSIGVSTLDVENRDIRMDGAHGQKFFARERTVDGFKLRRAGEVAAVDRAGRQEGQARGGGLERETDGKV